MDNSYRTPVEILHTNAEKATLVAKRAQVKNLEDISLRAKKDLPKLLKRALKRISRAADEGRFVYKFDCHDVPWFTNWNSIAVDLLQDELSKLGFDALIVSCNDLVIRW